MKSKTVTLISLLAFLMALLPGYANAQSPKQQTIKFRTQIEPKGNINLIITPMDGVKIDGCKLVTLPDGVHKAWEVEKEWITVTGPFTSFDCNMSGIDSIHFENIDKLTELNVNINKIRVLNLTGMTSLTSVDASTTEMREIDLTGCTNLKTLKCDGAKLVKVNLTAAKNLKKASLTINQLRDIDLTGLDQLEEIDLANNGLVKLEVKGLPVLKNIGLSSNPLESVDFSSCPKLQTIKIKNGSLTSFSATNLPELEEINLYKNKLTTLKLENLPALNEIDLGSNNLTSVDFSKCAGTLTKINLDRNKIAGKFEMKGLSRVSDFSIVGNEITSFEIGDSPNLETLNVGKNKITTLDLTSCTSESFKEIYADNNKLSSIKLSKELEVVHLPDNQLETIDLSSCTSLETIDLGNNKLTSLSLSGLEKLTELQVYKNNIQGENMKKLIESLRSSEDGDCTLFIVTTRDPDENNICSSELVKQAKAKGWLVRDKRTNKDYDGAFLRTITCRTEGNGGSVKLNGDKESIQAYTDTKINVTVTPNDGYGLKTLEFAATEEGVKKQDIFNNRSFWVDRDGEVVATFTNDICKVKLKRIGHGVLKLDGDDLDLDRLPRGMRVKVIATVASDETEYDRELKTLKANGKNIKGEKEFDLNENTEVVAEFEWLRDEKDPYEGEIWESDFIEQIIRDGANVVLYPNPARGEVFIEGISGEATINLFTLEGVRVLSSTADSSGKAAFSVAGLTEGIYVVLVGNVSKRLIVRH